MQTKLINQEELATLRLTTPALEELTAQVINQLNGIADPLVRYATARFLRSVFEQATEDTNAAAVDYCLTQNIGSDGNMFEHEGLRFINEYKCDYNWGDNDTDEFGDPAGYNESKRKVSFYDKQLKLYKVKLNAAKLLIETAHPKMQPVNARWTMKFLIREG